MAEDSKPGSSTDADQELALMMASLGLPTTFGTSLEVKSTKKGRTVKVGASRVVGSHCDFEVVDVEHDVSKRGTDPTSPTHVEIPAQDCNKIFSDEILDLSGIKDSCIVDDVHHGASDKSSWEPVWDSDYQRYYYCNIHTWETTWEVPEGVEDYHAYSHTESVENFVDEIAVSAKPFQEDEPIEESYAYESSLFVSRQTSNCLREHTVSGEIGSVGLIVDGTNDSGVSVAPLGGNVDEESEENSEMTKRKITTKIRLPQGTHIRFPDSDDDDDDNEDEEKVKGIAILSSCETTESKDDLNGSQDDVCLVDDLPLVFGAVNEKDSEDNEFITILEERKRKRKFIRIIEKMPTEAWSGLAENLDPILVEEMSKRTAKYWYQRYRLFSRYDEGIKMDEEGWFSVTPESIAQHQARRMCSGGLIIDAFTGVGGNAIQFALRGNRVIAIDIDPVKIDCARHNAAIYGVADYIEFVVGDFFKIAPKLKAAGVFLSPPWGGPDYTSVDKFDLHTMIQPLDGFKLFQTAQAISPNVVLFLPRNVDLDQLAELSWLASPPLPCQVERNFVHGKLKTITAYYGEFARTKISD